MDERYSRVENYRKFRENMDLIFKKKQPKKVDFDKKKRRGGKNER